MILWNAKNCFREWIFRECKFTTKNHFLSKLETLPKKGHKNESSSKCHFLHDRRKFNFPKWRICSLTKTAGKKGWKSQFLFSLCLLELLEVIPYRTVGPYFSSSKCRYFAKKEIVIDRKIVWSLAIMWAARILWLRFIPWKKMSCNKNLSGYHDFPKDRKLIFQ